MNELKSYLFPAVYRKNYRRFSATLPKSKQAESAKLKVITFNLLWLLRTVNRVLMPAYS